MKISNLEKIGLVSLALSGCAPSNINNSREVKDTCELVHDVVFELCSPSLFPTPSRDEEAESYAKREQIKCEELDQDGQKSLLRSYSFALSVSKTRYY